MKIAVWLCLVLFLPIFARAEGAETSCPRQSAAIRTGLFDAKLFVQLDFDHLTVENRAQRLADMKAAGADAVQLAICEFFATGAARQAELAKLKDMIAYFEAAGYPVAVWCSSLGYGGDSANPDFRRRFPNRRRLKSLDGVEAAVCSTDDDYAEALAENVRDFIRAGAKFILWDDDFVQTCRPGLSCVCDEHLARCSRRMGRPVTSADVKLALSGGPNELRTVFLDEMGDSLLSLAKRLRAAADEVDPTVGMGLCASYTHYDLEGVDIERLLRAFQGRRQPRPVLRVSGAPYWADASRRPDWRKISGMDLSAVLEFVRFQKAYFRNTNVMLLDENDPYPRRSEVIPAGMCEVYDKVMLTECGSVRNKYMLRYGLNREDTAYLDAHLANLDKDAAIVRAFAGGRPVGFRIYGGLGLMRSATLPEPFAGEHDTKTLAAFPLAGTFLAQNGVPTQYERDDTPGAAFGPAVLAVPQSAYCRGLVIDLSAARILTKLGVDVGLREGDDFWFYENAKGGRFAVIGSDCLDISYGEGVGGFWQRLCFRLNGEKVPKTVEDIPFDEIWRRFTGKELPVSVSANRGVYVLAKEMPSGSLSCLVCNVRGEDSGDFDVSVNGRIRTTSLPAWGFSLDF